MRQPAAEQPEPAPLNFDNEPQMRVSEPAQPEPQPQPAAAEKVDEEIIAGAHLQSAQALKSKPVFPAGQDKSLLCKNLSDDVWNQL